MRNRKHHHWRDCHRILAEQAAVVLVQEFIIALNTLLHLRSNRTLMPMYNAELMTFRETKW
jgi:hypothetical protein